MITVPPGGWLTINGVRAMERRERIRSIVCPVVGFVWSFICLLSNPVVRIDHVRHSPWWQRKRIRNARPTINGVATRDFRFKDGTGIDPYATLAVLGWGFFLGFVRTADGDLMIDHARRRAVVCTFVFGRVSI
jgi:hypothetical protein